MTISAGITLNTLNTLRTIGYGKGCGSSVGKCNRISIYKTFRAGLCNRSNTVTCVTLDALCCLVGVYTVNVPIAALNCDNRSMTISAGITLNTLNTLCTIGYGEIVGRTIIIGNSVCIYKTFGADFFNANN